MTSHYSILNDALGPIFVGPSSSHTAAPARIGKTGRQLLGEPVRKAVITLDENGSYPTTYRGHGSDYGFVGGLLGRMPDTPGLQYSLVDAEKAGMDVTFKIADIGGTHPNAALLELEGRPEGCTLALLTHSTGGGMFEIVSMDGFTVSIKGDVKKIFILCAGEAEAALRELLESLNENQFRVSTVREGGSALFEIAQLAELDEGLLSKISTSPGVIWVRSADVLLPVASRFEYELPFATASEALLYSGARAIPMWRLALLYETSVGLIDEEGVIARVLHIIETMRSAAKAGLGGESRRKGYLEPKAAEMAEKAKTVKLIDVGVMNKVMLWATAVMEYNSTPGVIVAGPTGGSSGVLPGAVIAVGEEMGLPDLEITKAMLAAGLVGVFIANQATFGAEVAGCQAENGSGSAMAAAGIVELLGGSAEDGFKAASLAMQNLLGLVCDPIACLAEIPCVNRNTVAAYNAVASAHMVLCGFDPVIPLDETIMAMLSVGRMLPRELRCTGLGGLCLTDTAKRIEAELSVK